MPHITRLCRLMSRERAFTLFHARRAVGSALLAVLFADLDAADLAGDGLGHFGDELDDARILVGRGDAFDVVLQFFPELV